MLPLGGPAAEPARTASSSLTSRRSLRRPGGSLRGCPPLRGGRPGGERATQVEHEVVGEQRRERSRGPSSTMALVIRLLCHVRVLAPSVPPPLKRFSVRTVRALPTRHRETMEIARRASEICGSGQRASKSGVRSDVPLGHLCLGRTDEKGNRHDEQSPKPNLDRIRTAERLSEALAEVFAYRRDGSVLTDDVFLDGNRRCGGSAAGIEAFEEWYKSYAPNGMDEVTVVRTVPTGTGFVAELTDEFRRRQGDYRPAESPLYGPRRPDLRADRLLHRPTGQELRARHAAGSADAPSVSCTRHFRAT